MPENGSATEAFENTVERARNAEELGYSRFWVAEHHDFPDRLASTTPEALIAHLAAKTDSIRVGSGTVLLNHYSPYKVAETFGVLDSLAPDRIDLGLGRATGNPVSDYALQPDRSQRRRSDDHAEKINETAAHLHDGFPDDHQFSELDIARSAESVPEVWVLDRARRVRPSPASWDCPTVSRRSSGLAPPSRRSRPIANGSSRRRSVPVPTALRECSR